MENIFGCTFESLASGTVTFCSHRAAGAVRGGHVLCGAQGQVEHAYARVGGDVRRAYPCVWPDKVAYYASGRPDNPASMLPVMLIQHGIRRGPDLAGALCGTLDFRNRHTSSIPFR